MSEDNKNVKKQLRRQMLAIRNSLSNDELISAGIRLAEYLQKDEMYMKASEILAYASYGSEISTYYFIQKALEDKKNIYLPRVIDNDIIFYRINALDELKEGYKAIPEPEINSESYVYSKTYADISMILMPGLVFDTKGNRIGYGGGFYDRYLSDKPLLVEKSIAFAFEFQRVDNIPAEMFDLRPSKIIYI